MATGPWEDYQVATESGAKPAPVSGPWEKYGAAPVTAPPAAAVAPPVASSGAAPDTLQGLIAKAHNDPSPIVRAGANMADTIQRSPLTGLAEQGLAAGGNMIGKVGSGLAGLVTKGTNALGLTDTDPADVVHRVQDFTHVTPQTRGAQDVAALGATVAKPFQAAAAPLDKAIANAGPGVSTFVPAASEAVQDVASILPFGQAARAGKAASVVEGAAKPSVADPIGTVRGAGYVMRPSDVRATGAPAPGLVREALTSSAGQAKSAALTNQKLTTRLAGEDMGKPNATQLTDADYDKYRTNGPGKVYDATADALSNTSKEGKLAPDADTVSSLNSLAANQNPASALPPKAAGNVQRISKKIESGNYTGKDWRTDVSWVRAIGARDAADELESMAERSLSAGGNTPQVTAFQQARADFAKSYDYQRATAQRGQVDAQHLAALDAKYPNMLTGNAKIIATAGRTLPDVTKVPGGGINDMATTNGHIHSTAGIVSRAGQLAGNVLKKIPGMDPLSEGFQSRNFGRKMTPGEQTYVPSFGQKGPGPSPFAPRLDLTAPPGPVENPTQLGMSLAQGRPAAPQLDLSPPAGNIGEEPSRQLPMELAPGRGPVKKLGDVLAPADARRLHRVMGRREEQAGIPTDSLSIPRK